MTNSIRLWATDFPVETTEGDLWELFIRYGNVESIAMVHKFPPPPMAFVDMHHEEALVAIRNLDKQPFMGRILTVKESTQRKHKKHFIYALLGHEEHQCYVGETVDPKRRFRQHLNGQGDLTTIDWIKSLVSKPIPVILETVTSGYDTSFHAAFLETVWRLVAAEFGWKVFNFPILSEIRPELKIAVECRLDQWCEILDKTYEQY